MFVFKYYSSAKSEIACLLFICLFACLFVCFCFCFLFLFFVLFDIGLRFNAYELISFKLGIMIDTARLFSLILV